MTSKIKVDNINKVSDDSNIIKKCGTTTTIGSGASNPIVVDGSAITLGRCGGTVALASGATQTGFGRTGSVNWQTTKKTATFTATSGEGYFCDTSGGTFTLNLPSSPSAGDIVGLRDYAVTFATHNLTLGRGGSPLMGNAADKTLSTDFLSLTIVYVDGTKGWIPIEEGTGNVGVVPAFIQATGGTITTCGNFKIHSFTGPGTFTVNSLGNAAGGSDVVDYLVVAAGGGGGQYYGAGAGAGGARMSGGTASGCYSVGPLGTSPSPVAALSVTATGFPITVGAGGANGPPSGDGGDGNNSIFSTITSTGGGGGTGNNGPAKDGRPGGSGGGATGANPGGAACGGAGNTPPVSPPQGNNGGNNSPFPAGRGASGGGAGGAGAVGDGPQKGGIGIINNINPATGEQSGSSQYYAAGGNPSMAPAPSLAGALGGGGQGPGAAGAGAGGTNTGGGGGGNGCGATGGSGIVVIRYKFQ